MFYRRFDLPLRPPASQSLLEYVAYGNRFSSIWPSNRAFAFLRRISASGGEWQSLRLSTHPEKGSEPGISQRLHRQFEADLPDNAVQEPRTSYSSSADSASALLGLRRPHKKGEAAIRAKNWPGFERCLQRAPPNHGDTRPDTSRADFTWCMTALDWRFDIPETTAKLIEMSANAKETKAKEMVHVMPP